MPTNSFVLQSEIERLTGFGVEKLRKWRQRFGFPSAEHGVDGRAIYSRESVDRLLVIKRLIEAGFRPGQVVANTADENLKIFADLNLSKSDVERSESTNDFISLLACQPVHSLTKTGLKRSTFPCIVKLDYLIKRFQNDRHNATPKANQQFHQNL